MKSQWLVACAVLAYVMGSLAFGCSSEPAATSAGSAGSTESAGARATNGGASVGGGTAAHSGAPGVSGAGSAIAGAAGSSAAPGGASGAAGNPGAGGTTSTGGSSTGTGGTNSAGTSSAGTTSAGTSSAGTSSAGGTAVGSSGCGKTSTLKFGQVPNESGSNVGTGEGGWLTIQSAGQTRGFAVRLPANYDKSHPYPLIFAFHWNGGTADQLDTGGSNGYWWAYYGFQRKSNNGAIFVAPQGIGNGWPNTGGRDLTFTDDMLKLLEDNLCVDTTHIITSGFSYGGGMSYEIACSRAKVFRAAVIYEGGQLSGCDGGNDPIALWQTEGLTDTTVNMSLATPIRDRFVKNNGCTVQNPPQPPQPPPYLSTGGHICTDYAGCSTGHPVRWCVHQSGHGPGPVDGTSDLYNSCATPPKSCSASCPCTWTPDDAWAWLSAL